MFDRAALAPRLFLALHDPFTGKPEVGPDLLARGIAAAVLATLLIDRRIDVVDGKVTVYPSAAPGAPQRPPTDVVEIYVTDAVVAQGRAHSMRAWIESLGGPLTEIVADELVGAGVVRRERRMLGRGIDRFPGADIVVAGGPRVRLQHMLAHPWDFDLEHALVAAIISALGMERVLDGEGNADLLVELTAHLPRVVRQLVDGLVASASALALTVRR